MTSAGAVYRLNPLSQSFVTVSAPAAFTHIAVGSSNSVWGLDASDKVYLYSNLPAGRLPRYGAFLRTLPWEQMTLCGVSIPAVPSINTRPLRRRLANFTQSPPPLRLLRFLPDSTETSGLSTRAAIFTPTTTPPRLGLRSKRVHTSVRVCRIQPKYLGARHESKRLPIRSALAELESNIGRFSLGN